MLGKRFTILLSDGRLIECDTVVSLSHSVDAKATKFPVESDQGGMTSEQDHVVREPLSSEIEAIVSDTPLLALEPRVPNRAETVWQMLEAAAQLGKAVKVQAGYRNYERALLLSLRTEDVLVNMGQLRFKVTVQELLTATARTARLRKKVKTKAKHKVKVQQGVKFADKIKAVAAGTASSVQ